MKRLLSVYKHNLYSAALNRVMMKIRKGDNTTQTIMDASWLVRKVQESLRR